MTLDFAQLPDRDGPSLGYFVENAVRSLDASPERSERHDERKFRISASNGDAGDFAIDRDFHRIADVQGGFLHRSTIAAGKFPKYERGTELNLDKYGWAA